MTEVQRLDVLIEVREVRAESYPSRQLVFDLGIAVMNQVEIGVLNSWSKVYLGDACVAEGPLLQVFSALIHPTTVGGVHQVSASIRAPLPSDVLYLVEEKRAGGDLPYRLDIRITGLPIKRGVLEPRYGLPQTLHVRDTRNSGWVSGTIAQSEWVQLMRRLNWSEARLVEIPITIPQGEYPNAYRHLEETTSAGVIGMRLWRPAAR